jgi:dTDP-4-dehydrorhamnose reductase
MRIIIGDGKMSQVIRKTHDVVLGHKDIEITNDPAKLAKILRKASEHSTTNANVVINTAARINLEWCEENQEEAYKINTLGALNLARACDILGFKFVQISSGCLFDGEETNRVYTEEDTPTPASFYAVTKSAADTFIKHAGLDIPVLTLRPRQIISVKPNSTNMLTKFMSIGRSPRFITSANSITGLEDFSIMIDHLLRVNASGVYNCASHGTISPYEIALKLKSIYPDLNPQPVKYAEYVKNIKVKRVNTILSVKKLQESGYATRSAEHVVDWCIGNYGRLS